MWGFLISLIMALLIGAIGNSIVGGNMPGGIIGAIIAGFAGTWLGTWMLGSWGPIIAGFPIVPAVIGAAVVVFLFSLLGKGIRQ